MKESKPRGLNDKSKDVRNVFNEMMNARREKASLMMNMEAVNDIFRLARNDGLDNIVDLDKSIASRNIKHEDLMVRISIHALIRLPQ